MHGGNSRKIWNILEIPRPYAATTLFTALWKELYIFSHVSVRAIVTEAYLCVIDKKKVHVTLEFDLGKAKLASQADQTIPRLDLGPVPLGAEIAKVIATSL